MDKYLSPEAIISDSTPLVKATKKINKKTKFDLKNVKSIYKVGFPEILGRESMYNSKYKIKLVYKDSQGKEHDKTILFGHPQRFDFVDHKNIKLRDVYLSSLASPKSREHPEFDPVFWERLLLNGEEENLSLSFMKLKDIILK
jgi:hypothetical protein